MSCRNVSSSHNIVQFDGTGECVTSWYCEMVNCYFYLYHLCVNTGFDVVKCFRGNGFKIRKKWNKRTTRLVFFFIIIIRFLWRSKTTLWLHVSALYRFLLSACTRWCLQLYNHFYLALWLMVSTHFCTHKMYECKKTKDWWVNIHIILHYAVAINTMWESLAFLCPLDRF